jgi:hypothetical protein
MKHLLRILACAMLVIVSAALPTKANPEGCRDAADQYNSAIGDIGDYLKRYANCVEGSRGHDDCSSEFSHLKSDQADFESAVSEYESECN